MFGRTRIEGLSVVHARATLGLVTVVLRAEEAYGNTEITLALDLGDMADAFLGFLDEHGPDGWTLYDDTTLWDTRLVSKSGPYWHLATPPRPLDVRRAMQDFLDEVITLSYEPDEAEMEEIARLGREHPLPDDRFLSLAEKIGGALRVADPQEWARQRLEDRQARG